MQGQVRGSLRKLMCEFAHQAKELKLKHPSDILLNRFLLELNIVAVFKKQSKKQRNKTQLVRNIPAYAPSQS